MTAWRRVRDRRSDNSERQRGRKLRGLCWTVLAGLLLGWLGFFQPIDDAMRTARNKLHMDRASGDVVLVAVDERSLRELHNWPLPRSHYARLLDKLSEAGARRIFLNVFFSSPSSEEEDRALAHALVRSKAPVIQPVATVPDDASGRMDDILPLKLFRDKGDLASTELVQNFQNTVWHLPYTSLTAGRAYSSLASSLAEVSAPSHAPFPVDYSIAPGSIPTVSAVDLLQGRVSREALSGKDVLIGATAGELGDLFYIPGHGRMTSVYVHALGAETLKAGRPLAFGWLPAFVLAVIAAAAATRLHRAAHTAGLLASATVLALGLPAWLEHKLLYFDIAPGLFVLLTTSGAMAWSRLRQRAAINAVSGLPNLHAFRADRSGGERPLVAARVLNYAEIVASLPPQQERAFVGQIAARLSVGAPGRKLYHGDDGLFVWFADDGAGNGEHLDALCALFRSPILADGAPLDVVITFGVDEDCGRSIGNRLGSALLAADEAAAEGLKWKAHDPEKLKDAAWKLSLLGQLDAAIDSGDLWVAYQPQLDLRSGRITGAEALVRWTHPTKGAIGPMEFIPAAEQHDRIERLTWFVLDRAVSSAAAINRRGVPFSIAVNLSARLLGHSSLPEMVADRLDRHGLDPALLTLEVTETAALSGGEYSFELLRRLRQLGVAVAIDDYGTGQSTLEYIKNVPASEIKIDQGFVQAVCRSRSDRLLVHSTIQLAHALGQRVVAEGIEDEETLAALVQMGCDVAQGYLIGRPTSFRVLSRRVLSEQRSQAA